jgi:hypothetical protein
MLTLTPALLEVVCKAGSRRAATDRECAGTVPGSHTWEGGGGREEEEVVVLIGIVASAGRISCCIGGAGTGSGGEGVVDDASGVGVGSDSAMRVSTCTRDNATRVCSTAVKHDDEDTGIYRGGEGVTTCVGAGAGVGVDVDDACDNADVDTGLMIKLDCLCCGCMIVCS